MSSNRGKTALFDDASFEINKNERNTHDTQGTQHTLDTQDAQPPKRKQKHPRINMAFYGDNLNYLRDAAWAAKMSVTEYVNTLVCQDRKK